MIAALLALQVAVAAAPGNGDIAYSAKGIDWEWSISLAGRIDVNGNEDHLFSDFWAQMFESLTATVGMKVCGVYMKGQLSDKQFERGFGTVDRYSILIIEVFDTGTKRTFDDWAVYFDDFGRVEITGRLPDRARRFFVRLGQALSKRCGI